jgi:hypothetical protein
MDNNVWVVAHNNIWVVAHIWEQPQLAAAHNNIWVAAHDKNVCGTQAHK